MSRTASRNGSLKFFCSGGCAFFQSAAYASNGLVDLTVPVGIRVRTTAAAPFWSKLDIQTERNIEAAKIAIIAEHRVFTATIVTDFLVAVTAAAANSAVNRGCLFVARPKAAGILAFLDVSTTHTCDPAADLLQKQRLATLRLNS
jgi:hypothetical protein